MGNKSVNFWLENRNQLHDTYQERLQGYRSILDTLSGSLQVLVAEAGIKGIVKGRIKGFEAFHRKLLVKTQKTLISDPFHFIKDMIGLRIVVPFIEDISLIESLISDRFQVLEVEKKAQNRSIHEFGYDSTHMLIHIPQETIESSGLGHDMIAEIQIRTILQDAWAEVEHELVYKTTIDKVEDTIRKKLIALNATLSLADTIFQEIRDYQRKRYQELQSRHNQLLEKVSTIPEKMPGRIDNVSEIKQEHKQIFRSGLEPINGGLNDLLVEALNAHLENRLEQAVELYTQILAVSPIHYIFNHRGLVYFALSEYEKAIEDFTRAIDMNTKDTRVYTNRGLAHRMLKQYDLALADFNKSLELNPLWPDTFYGRSLTHYDMGNIQAALEDCDKAINLRPNFKQVVRFKQFLMNQMQG